VLRLLLVLALINGLVPAFGEALELVADYAVSGHVAHLEPFQADQSPDDEYGCGPTEHHCRCCASQSLLPTALPGLVLLDVRESPRTPFVHEAVAERPGVRLLRPPIRA
jgi:hypothetical protein